ncbi:MAG TPA: hypothetical protein VIL46_17395, partial [Gemmataceae bacterium]
PARPAEGVSGFVLTGACRYYEFTVRSADDSGERVHIDAEVVRAGRLRDFFGFNRAKHAVLEAAILATRLHLLPPGEVAAEFRKLAVVVDKTGGEPERAAFEFLRDKLEAARRRGAPGAEGERA